MTNQNENGSSNSPFMGIFAPLVAILVLLAFGWFIFYLLGQTGAAEPVWSRTIFLFNGVEAIAFAAAGFIFGREVHRQQAEKAEERADKNQKDAASGRALAAVAKFKDPSQRQAPSIADGQLGAAEAPALGQATPQSDLQEVANLARELFPDPRLARDCRARFTERVGNLA